MSVALICDACGDPVSAADAVEVMASRANARPFTWHVHPNHLNRLKLVAPEPVPPPAPAPQPTAYLQSVPVGEQITEATPREPLELSQATEVAKPA